MSVEKKDFKKENKKRILIALAILLGFKVVNLNMFSNYSDINNY